MELNMRPATDTDIPFLLSLRRETMDAHLTASGASTSDEQHRVRLMKHFECAMILLMQDEPVGLLKVSRNPGIWEIIQIQLTSQLRGRGIGRTLIESVIADATTAGADVKLSVLKANPAKNLYERLGFKVAHEDMHEYFMHRAA